LDYFPSCRVKESVPLLFFPQVTFSPLIDQDKFFPQRSRLTNPVLFLFPLRKRSKVEKSSAFFAWLFFGVTIPFFPRFYFSHFSELRVFLDFPSPENLPSSCAAGEHPPLTSSLIHPPLFGVFPYWRLKKTSLVSPLSGAGSTSLGFPFFPLKAQKAPLPSFYRWGLFDHVSFFLAAVEVKWLAVPRAQFLFTYLNLLEIVPSPSLPFL